MRNLGNKRFRKIIFIITIFVLTTLSACEDSGGAREDTANTLMLADKLQQQQPTPTDIDYSLERYNLIRRLYWVNGERERANMLECPIVKPLGYIVLLTESGSVIGKFIVDGKVSSLNSYLTPDSEYYECSNSSSVYRNRWLADVDGSYGENDNGIFFFTPDGRYIEWTGIYLYSDIPFEIDDPVVKVGESNG